MIKKMVGATTLAAVTLSALGTGASAGNDGNGPMPFDPIAGSAYGGVADLDAPWVIPEGYVQEVLSDEQDLDIYAGANDWNDMNTVNETGLQRGRYLYRTHEVRAGSPNANGSVSVVDLRTGEAKVLVQRLDWDALDGIRWTPWGTLLFAEEATRGKLYEVELVAGDPTTAAAVHERSALGAMAHEGIEVGPDGAVYVIDELRGGAIYRFVPDRRGDLSSGQLSALKVTTPGTSYGTGEFEWVPLDRTAVGTDARAAAAAAGATGFQRPEDLERIGDTLYVAITEADPGEVAGRVMAIDLSAQVIREYVAVGTNALLENAAGRVTGFAKPDNLAQGPDGRLWIVEDNIPSDIWVASGDRGRDGAADAVRLFASLGDFASLEVGAEGTGIYFGSDPQALFVNVQHSITGNDKTMVIRPSR